jgi:cell filamentation protein
MTPVDPYVYPGTDVLRNKFDIRDPEAALEAEAIVVMQRLREDAPRVPISYDGYKQLHHHLFQDVYEWAGEARTINTVKGGQVYCRVPYIAAQMEARFEAVRADLAGGPLTQDVFAAKAAEHICEINAIHPFREGNGRSQRLFLEVLAREAGHRVDIERIDPEAWTAARRHSFDSGDYEPMRQQIVGAIGSRDGREDEKTARIAAVRKEGEAFREGLEPSGRGPKGRGR